MIIGANVPTDSLTVEFSRPSSGWIEIRLANSTGEVRAPASHIYPSLQQLCAHACDLASGRPGRRVVFLLEPDELELSTVAHDADADAVELLVTRFQGRRSGDGAVVFSHVAPPRALALTLWRSLRRLQTSVPAETFAREWREYFPDSDMAALTRLVGREG